MPRRFLVLTVLSLFACGGGSSAGGGQDEATTGDGGSGTSGTDTTDSSDTDETGDAGGEGEWESLAPLPTPRQETGVAAMGGRVYVVGGITPGAPVEIVRTVELYDPDADAWSEGPELPLAMHHANLSAVGDTLFVTGYLTTLQFLQGGDVFALVDGADTWQSRTPMPTGTERGGSGVAVHAGQVWVFGGFRDDAAVADASTYVVAENQWLALPPMPGARDHLVAGAIDGMLYVVGGRDSAIEAHTDVVWVFDPKAETWSEGTPAPTSRAGLAGAVHEKLLYVFGGEGNADAQSGVFPQAEAYDPLSDSWQALPDMPTPRHGMGAAAVGDRVHVPGGADVEAFGPVATHEAWRISG